jgi:hypothetical protein
MKYFLFSFPLLIFIALFATSSATASVDSYCIDVHDHGIYAAIHCISVNYQRATNPNRIKCNTDGTRSVRLFNGYSYTGTIMTCSPKSYTTGYITQTSKITMFKGGKARLANRWKCKIYADPNKTTYCQEDQWDLDL